MFSINYSNKNFLIIDNIKPSHDILKKFAMTLTTKQVDSTYYAQNVISLCLEKQYDIILLGYNLGEKQKNGQQILEELRTSEVISRHCVVIIITAEVSQAMVLAALEHKPDSYLCKPYSINALHKRLNKCMMKKQAMHSIYQALEKDDKQLTVTLVNKALANNTPYRIECLGIKSRQFFELQQFNKAQKIYLAYQNEPNCQWADIGLGKIALENKDLVNAEIIFKNIITQQPLYLPAYDWLADTYQTKYDNIIAEETLEQAIQLSPRSVRRLKKYAGLCFDNKHFEKAADAYQHVYELAYNSIHHCPENALLFVKSLAGYSDKLSLLDAKRMNNRAFTMLSQMNRNFNQASLKVQSDLLTACLLENIHDYALAKEKITHGMDLLNKERQNMETSELTDIAYSLTKLNRSSKASLLLTSVNQQKENQSSSAKIGQLSGEQLNEGYTIKAQEALAIGKELYEKEEYKKAISSLTEALVLFPNHKRIKLNLIQVLLSAYEDDKFMIDELKRAKKIILELITITKEHELYARLKKMQKKYQQLAGI
ncbi:response regulator [Candidatus Colwellia aromaticivorans]|uniref:response regulator n=1 Tax=Candidatus Colwellia aromaticivorans TaxID=2267621 RepID=UPI000DF1B6A4|nr:response regulator [Candidatus Colwellia aromaticivorans]